MSVGERKRAAEATAEGLGLRARGAAFWVSTCTDYELSAAELELLAEVCRQLDLIDDLRAAVERDGVTVRLANGMTRPHGNLAELRQVQLAASRIVAMLALPNPETGEAVVQKLTTARAKSAAGKRWTP